MAVRVQVPASAANLGPAFDCAAIALNLHLRVSAEPRSSGGFEVRYRGVNEDRVPSGEENLIVKAIRSFAAAAKAEIAGARKTTDALAGRFQLEDAIEPKIAAFEKFMGTAVAATATA